MNLKGYSSVERPLLEPNCSPNDEIVGIFFYIPINRSFPLLCIIATAREVYMALVLGELAGFVKHDP